MFVTLNFHAQHDIHYGSGFGISSFLFSFHAILRRLCKLSEECIVNLFIIIKNKWLLAIGSDERGVLGNGRI